MDYSIIRRTVLWKFAVTGAAMLAASFPAAASASEAAVFEAIRGVEAQVAEIGFRLATANAMLCDQHEPSLGLLLHSPEQYAADTRSAAIAYFRFDGPIGVEAVVPHSPAAAAEIRADDSVIGVEHLRFRPADIQTNASTDAILMASRQIMAFPADVPLTLHIRRDGVDEQRTVTPVSACRTRFEALISDSFLAQADGDLVQISSRFLADYPAWAPAAIAHELAHNILRHSERLQAKGTRYGLLANIGRNVGYFRQTELEADILSVSLLANAGYDPKIAVLFWQDFGPSHAGSVLRSRTHPGWKTRVSVIEREIAALGADLPHLPAIIAARDRPLDGKWQDLLTEEGVFSGG